MDMKTKANNLLDDLKEFYDKCSPEEKDVFADVVNSCIKEEEGEKTEKEPENKQEPIEFKGSIPFEQIKTKKHTTNIYGYLSDFEITKLVQRHNLIEPFFNYKVSTKDNLSFGLEPYGYTCRLSNYFIRLSSSQSDVIDPKNPSGGEMHQVDKIVIEPQETILTMTVEEVRLPEGIKALIYPKSSYCRCGIMGLFAPIEPGFIGRLTLSLHNTNKDKKVVLYPKEGIAQIQFIRPFSLTSSLYKGKYKGTQKPTRSY